MASGRVRGVAVLMAAGLALTSACSGADGDDGAEGAEVADGAPSGAPQAEQVDAGTSARAEVIDPDDVIVEQTVALPTNPNNEVTWGVLSLRVEGEVMTLRLAVTPQFGTRSASEAVTLYDTMQRTTFLPVLVDMENLKEYSVITDLPHYWRSDPVGTQAVNGQTMLAWAVFAAPEDDIDTITVRIADWWPPFVDVPIER